MGLDAMFLETLLEKYAVECRVSITDATTRIMASTMPGRVGTASRTAQYIMQVRHPATIENPDSRDNATVTYGAPVYHGGELWGTVVVHGTAAKAPEQGNILRISLEAALEYEGCSKRLPQQGDGQAEIMRLLLAEQVDSERVGSLMRRQEMDTGLLRTVICIHLLYHQNSYFNINLNLGYDSTIEQLKSSVIHTLRGSRYVNAKDIVYSYDRETVLVLKAFHPATDHSRIYLALDEICRDMAGELETLGGLSARIAYGNLYTEVADLRNSFSEAREMLAVGRAAGKEASVYTTEELLFDTTCHFLHPQIVGKLIRPNLRKLRKKDGTLCGELLECGEAFVDQCMSITATSQISGIHRNTIRARLEKLRLLTGLDPAVSFRDAFLIKLLAVYVRHYGDEEAIEEERKRQTV